jgi:glutathione S-transferase
MTALVMTAFPLPTPLAAVCIAQAADRPEDLARQLAVLNHRLAENTSLLSGSWGPVPWGAADCAVQAYLAYLPIFCPQVSLDPYPRIQASIAATQARPAYRLVMGLP